MRIEAASCATKGARAYQEDTSALWPDARPADSTAGEPPGSTKSDGAAQSTTNGRAGLLLATLADGMGGHAGGALASKMVCKSFMASLTGRQPDDETQPDNDVLMRALNAANDTIAEIVSKRPELSGMGSTLIGASFGTDGMSWISVGDSPLYLYRRGEIALLNEDHSLAPALDQLARDGKITEEQARQDPRRHMLRSAITGDDLELIDVSKKPLRVENEDLFILASDGIHTLEPDEIARVVSAYNRDGAVAVSQALVRAVNDMRAPHQDNTTVVVVRPLA